MKTLSRWDHLTEFGIDPLTGEACGLGFRILCDVTDAGKAIICKALGVPSIQFAENWNSGTPPHTGSIMVAPEMFVTFAAFALLENGYDEAWQIGEGVFGFNDDDPEKAEIERFYLKDRKRIFRYRGTAGHRNRHEFTGRVE